MTAIALAAEPSLHYLIGDPEDPVEVWKKLQNQFQRIHGQTALFYAGDFIPYNYMMESRYQGHD